MTVRPGRNLIRLFAVLLAISPLVFVVPQVSWLVAAPLPVALLAIGEYRKLKRQVSGFTLKRQLPSVWGRDRSFAIEWTLERSDGPAVTGEWRECFSANVVPEIHSGSFRLAEGERSASVSEEVRIPVRGQHTVGPFWIRIAGPLGLVEMQREIDDQATVRILPETYHSPDELRKDRGAELVLLDKKARSRQHGIGTEFESLHEYRDGDDPRRIDWRATARMRRPVVRRFQIERHRDVMIVVDCGRLMGTDAGRGSKLDCAVDSALLLAKTALQGGDRCGMALFDDQVVGYLNPVSGVSSMNAIADCVYDVQTRWRETDFTRMFATLQQKQRKRSLIVILSDLVDAETTTRYRASLAGLASRHVVLFAALRTPIVQELAEAPITTLMDGARSAVSFRLLRERAQALHAVRRSSVTVLDLAPSQVTVPLINQFVELRHSSRM
ncbi:MAG: DUF58 domain-containing protein [Planctomycetota bacterium]|jgi:uncharacterized protein (DUF58 family)